MPGSLGSTAHFTGHWKLWWLITLKEIPLASWSAELRSCATVVPSCLGSEKANIWSFMFVGRGTLLAPKIQTMTDLSNLDWREIYIYIYDIEITTVSTWLTSALGSLWPVYENDLRILLLWKLQWSINMDNCACPFVVKPWSVGFLLDWGCRGLPRSFRACVPHGCGGKRSHMLGKLLGVVLVSYHSCNRIPHT